MVVGSAAPAGEGNIKEEDGGAENAVEFKVMLFATGNAASASASAIVLVALFVLVLVLVLVFDGESNSSDAFMMIVLERW